MFQTAFQTAAKLKSMQKCDFHKCIAQYSVVNVDAQWSFQYFYISYHRFRFNMLIPLMSIILVTVILFQTNCEM